MDPTFLIGPAVVAAVISALVSGIGILISARTTRAIHTEKLTFDREQAERRIDAEIALAEKKVDLERAFEAWKRQTEFAEQIIADFYEARDIINAARMPGSFGDEGSTRQKEDWETEHDTSRLNSYYVPAERLFDKSEFFSNLHARRNRFLAMFGQESAKPFDDIYKIRGEVLIAVRMLISTHRNCDQGTLPATRREWEAVMGWVDPETDGIPRRLDQAVEAIEKTCRTATGERAP
jgi:hypothetical protein